MTKFFKNFASIFRLIITVDSLYILSQFYDDACDIFSEMGPDIHE